MKIKTEILKWPALASAFEWFSNLDGFSDLDGQEVELDDVLPPETSQRDRAYITYMLDHFARFYEFPFQSMDIDGLTSLLFLKPLPRTLSSILDVLNRLLRDRNRLFRDWNKHVEPAAKTTLNVTDADDNDWFQYQRLLALFSDRYPDTAIPTDLKFLNSSVPRATTMMKLANHAFAECVASAFKGLSDILGSGRFVLFWNDGCCTNEASEDVFVLPKIVHLAPLFAVSAYALDDHIKATPRTSLLYVKEKICSELHRFLLRHPHVILGSDEILVPLKTRVRTILLVIQTRMPLLSSYAATYDGSHCYRNLEVNTPKLSPDFTVAIPNQDNETVGISKTHRNGAVAELLYHAITLTELEPPTKRRHVATAEFDSAC